MVAPAPVAPTAQPMAAAEAPIPVQIVAAPPMEAPAAPPAPALVAAPIAAPVAAVAPPIAASAPAMAAPAPQPAPAVPQRPLVDENDWRVSRPAPKPPVRAAEPIARPVAARAGSESRAPNLFQRITGAFAAPKPMVAAAAEPPAARPAPENVVAVAPKPVPRPAPAQASINLDVTERAKPARDDDDLQIPAFLRRQAN
jgi:cell division protein FtsZ